MWLDNETEIDFVNFSGVAESVAELIVQADGKPLSIGVSGPWGAGKSSLIKLTKQALASRQAPGPDDAEEREKYIFVDFNAWLYQGYDDARAALMESIAVKLAELAVDRKTGIEKTQDFLKSIDWFRAASLTAGSAVALALGLPPVGIFGQAANFIKRVRESGADSEVIEDGQALVEQGFDTAKGLVKPGTQQSGESAREKIAELRHSFEKALEELGVTLVVLIDDLDRCMPETAVSTLEAIRLFLFLEGTAFVIAADDQMIKHAVRRHFDNPDESLVTNYFDKLIQIPIRVPQLGTQEVRAYMFLLFVHASSLSADNKEAIREAIITRLRESWQGKRIDRMFVESLEIELPADLVLQLDTADRLGPIMTNGSGIAGNPRLIKRFLNALSIRMTVSRAQGVSVDEAVLAKLMLFERLAPEGLYAELATAIIKDPGGRPSIIAGWENRPADEPVSLDGLWDNDFVRDWLALRPALGDLDLRGALYVSREHLPVITPEDGLSSRASEVLSALLSSPEVASQLTDDVTQLAAVELNTIMGRLLDQARREEVWGTPAILEALLVLARANDGIAKRLAGFLGDRPASQIQPDIVPKIADEPWAKDLFKAWSGNNVSAPVSAAMKMD